KLNVEAAPDLYKTPFFVTDQAYVNVSSDPASVTAGVTEIADPSFPLDGALATLTVGATFVTVIELLVEPIPPSLSVAASVTTYVPLSVGVNENDAPLPLEYAPPFFSTTQPYVIVSSTPTSVAEPVRPIAVPSGELVGAPVIAAVGETLVTANDRLV